MHGHAQYHHRQEVLGHPVEQGAGVEYELVEEHIQRHQCTGSDDQPAKRVGNQHPAHAPDRQHQANDHDHLHQHFDVPIVEQADLAGGEPVGNQQQRLPVQPGEYQLDQCAVQQCWYHDGCQWPEQRACIATRFDGLELKARQGDAGDQEQHRGFAEYRPVVEITQVADHNQDDGEHADEHRHFHYPPRAFGRRTQLGQLAHRQGFPTFRQVTDKRLQHTRRLHERQRVAAQFDKAQPGIQARYLEDAGPGCTQLFGQG
ncbi:hypothetical protein D3C75_694250 [compost metagenome]